MNELDRIHESSHYLSTLLRRRPELVEWLTVRKSLHRRYPLTELYGDLQRSISGAQSFEQLLSIFREFKQRHFLRIGGRDLLGWADLTETTAQLSDLAGVALQVGLEALSANPQWWVGETERGLWPQIHKSTRFTVMGMGKLGGQELNYVSDVDLLFLTSPVVEDKPRSPETLVLLNRLCQWLSRLLAEAVEGDRVFQVDLRLRPQGRDGPLVPSLAAATDHYLHHGRAWERQVLLKARPVAGDRSMGMAFLQEVRPFVFRRFLDFQALDELKAMRDRILAEAVRPGSGWQQFDVKLGVGGIREIEFLVQSFQLVYGGRHPELDEPNTLRCLERLHDLALLSEGVVEELKTSYTFLRRVEHWVQLDQNRQTQKLPQSQEGRARLSLALGFGPDVSGFLQRLEACCGAVHGHFRALFHSSDRSEDSPGPKAEPAGTDAVELASLNGFSPQLLSRLQAHLAEFPDFLQRSVGELLQRYAALSDEELREKVLIRLERYFSQVRKRHGLMKVFHGSAPWLEDFCRGLVQSELLAELLGHYPSLVEGVATASGAITDAASWEVVSERLLNRSEDYEEGLEWIRRLKNERLLQLAIADLRGDFGSEVLEEQLSHLADFVVRVTYERVRSHMHLRTALPLTVLALGKLGSREMSYLSDLDLVFVYRPEAGESEEHIPEEVIRFIQRFMRMLSTPLQEGPGYAVDARLRPTGSYGPLIVTRNAWLKYYEERADLWEIQALLRVRAVAGDRELGHWIETVAQRICYRKRNASEVWSRLCHLRQRMQQERSEERGDLIDIKLGHGGLTDFEFLVQGILLIEGSARPSLRGSSVRRTLDPVLEHLSDAGIAAREVKAGFDALRCLEHRLRLHTNLSASRLSRKQFETLQAIGLWPSAAEEGTAVEEWQDLLRLRRRIRALLQRFCPDL